jgi:hypothetical protein
MNKNGGAIYSNNNGNTVSNCVFVNTKTNDIPGYDGALYLSNGSMSACNFTNINSNSSALYLRSGSVSGCIYSPIQLVMLVMVVHYTLIMIM